MGKNLHVLSQIEGVDLEMYKETVLPRVLEQVILLLSPVLLFFNITIQCSIALKDVIWFFYRLSIAKMILPNII